MRPLQSLWITAAGPHLGPVEAYGVDGEVVELDAAEGVEQVADLVVFGPVRVDADQRQPLAVSVAAVEHLVG